MGVRPFGFGGPAVSTSASSSVTATLRHFCGAQQQQRPRRPLPTRSTAVPPSPTPTTSEGTHSGAAAQVGADSAADSQQLQFVGHSAAGHAARCRFVALVDRLVWADAFGASSNTNSETVDEAPASSSASSSSSGGGAASMAIEPCPTLDELVAAFFEGSAELSDVLSSSDVSASSSSSPSAAASSSVASAAAGLYPTLCAANASFVTALEAREAIVAFVEATARALQSPSMHRLIEERAASSSPSSSTPSTTPEGKAAFSLDPPASDPATTTATTTAIDAAAASDESLIDGPPERIIPSMRRVAIAAAAELLPHAAEAHDSVDEAVALLTCAAAVLTLAPPMAERAAMRRLLVPATVVCRRLMGPDMATLMLCLARVYDATPANSSSSSSSMFLSYSSLADLKALELELFRRFDATFAKYTPPPIRGGSSRSSSSSTSSGGSPRDGPLSVEQREAHRRQFIAARQRALLTLTDVAEIATAFAIHRFVGSADMAFAPAATLATCGGAAHSSSKPSSALSSSGSVATQASGKRPISNSKAPPTPAALRSASSSTATHSADTSRLWARIVQYTIDFVAHDLRLSAEARAAAAAAEREALSVLMGDGDGETDEPAAAIATMAGEKGLSNAAPGHGGREKEKKNGEGGDDDDDMIDTTFTRADLQSICFALDRVGCRSGYDRLMSFLVMRGVVRRWIDPPSASFGHSGPLRGERVVPPPQ